MGRKERTKINECYMCEHKRSIPGDAHIRCANPDPGMKGEWHGVRNGWFNYPFNKGGNMETNFDKIQKLNKAILEDTIICLLLDKKSQFLNSLKPKYLVDKKANTMTAILNANENKIIEKIDLLIKHRTEQIKRFYA